MSDVIRYNSKSVFVSTGDFNSVQNVSGSLSQISRVQDMGLSFNSPIIEEEYITDNTEEGLVSRSSVDFTVNWLLTNGANERAIGFVTNGLSGAFLKINQEKNIYIATEKNNVDIIGANYNTQKNVLGIGNATLNSYSLRGSVGSFPEATATFVGLNAMTYTGSIEQLVPAVLFQNGSQINNYYTIFGSDVQKDEVSSNSANNISALNPKDIILEFENKNPFGILSSSLHLQSFEISLNLERAEIRGMGQVYPEKRPVIYPIDINFSAEALIPSYVVDNLSERSCLGTGTNINLIIKRPCSDFVAFELKMKQMKLEGQSSSISLDGYEQVSLQFIGSVSNPFSLTKNLFIEAYQGELVYELVEILPITGYDNNGVFYYNEESVYERKMSENTFSFTNE